MLGGEFIGILPLIAKFFYDYFHFAKKFVHFFHFEFVKFLVFFKFVDPFLVLIHFKFVLALFLLHVDDHIDKVLVVFFQVIIFAFQNHLYLFIVI